MYILLANSFMSSFLWAALGLAIAAILGYFIGNLTKKTTVVEEVAETDTSGLEKEIQALEKKLSNAEKNYDKLRKERNRINEKLTDKSEAYEELLKEFKQAKIEMEDKLADYNALEKRKDQIEEKYSRFKIDYDAIKKEILNERNEKNSFRNKAKRAEKELEDFRNRLITEQKRSAQLQASLDELETVHKKLEDLRINYKVQSRKVKKLEKDCQYWEDQHYKTHHELTEQRDKYEELLDLNQERHLQILRMREEKKSHLAMIADYKGRFVKLHDEVHNNSK